MSSPSADHRCNGQPGANRQQGLFGDEGWFRLSNAVIDRLAAIGPLAFAVYAVLAKCADRDGRSFPSVSTISRLAGVSRRSSFSALQLLVANGMIRIDQSKAANGANATNRYCLLPLDPGERNAPPPVQDTHQGGAFPAPPPVQEIHQGGAKRDPPLVQKRTQEPDPVLTRPKEQEGSPAKVAGAPSDLIDWLTWWNGLKAAGLVLTGANPDKPTKAVLAAWRRVQRDKDLAALLSDRGAIRQALEVSPFAGQAGWFTPAKFLGGKNREGEFIVERLLNGGYRNVKGQRQAHIGPGQRFDPTAAARDPSVGKW